MRLLRRYLRARARPARRERRAPHGDRPARPAAGRPCATRSRTPSARPRSGTRLALNVALDYSARDAIANAAAAWLGDDSPQRAAFGRLLALQGQRPGRDVDLLIRTGGEKRLSDFLLWECAYAELVFTGTHVAGLRRASTCAPPSPTSSSRERRFGGLPASRRNEFNRGRSMTDTTQRSVRRAGRYRATPRRRLHHRAPRPITPRSRCTRSLLVAGLAIATVLPNMFISNLIEEREQRQTGVRAEFTRNWGRSRPCYGPVLVIPYQAGERPRHLRADRAGEARSRRNAEPAGAPARPVPARLSTTRDSTCRARSWCRPKRGCAKSSPTRTGASSGTRRRSRSAPGARSPACGPSDNITVDGTPSAVAAVPRSVAPEHACKGAAHGAGERSARRSPARAFA